MTVQTPQARNLPHRHRRIARKGLLFRYPGSKWKLMPHIIPLFPFHKTYVSVFGGTGSDIMLKPNSRFECFNDLDKHISSLFRLLQDDQQVEALIRRIEVTPARSLDTYKLAIQTLAEGGNDAVQNAYAFLVASHQGICCKHAAMQKESNWGYFRKPSGSFGTFLKLPDMLRFATKRFRSVQITDWDWHKVIQRLDGPETLAFLDPPYEPSTVKYHYYVHEMTVEDHAKMLATLHTLKGFCVLCGYDNPMYSEALAHWRRVEFATHANVDAKGTRPHRIECVWMNFNEAGRKIA